MFVCVNKEKWSSSIRELRDSIIRDCPDHSCQSCYLDLAGLKVVRLVVGDPAAMSLIRRELCWILREPVENPDATIYLWKEPDVKAFAERFAGHRTISDPNEEFLLFKVINQLSTSVQTWPSGQVNLLGGSVHLADGDTFFYGFEDFSPDRWIAEGHVFVQMLFRILNETPAAKLVHGACVGMNDKGLLLCARGQKGKSTLAVTAMLEGFDFVSEDYLILEKSGDGLLASPIYSIITLSPFMYDKLYDRLGKARFVGVSSFKGKYVFDISEYKDRLKRRYPVKACLFPEITPDATEPRVELCGQEEKNRAITHMAHSTLFQMWSQGLKQKQLDQEFMLSIIGMLKGLDFYKIILTPDIFKNAGCLKSFVESI